MSSPNTDLYQLGKGVVYFNQLDLTTGLYHGERDLGNAPSFSMNVAMEKLDHYSSRGGIKAKDAEVVSSLTPSLSFSLDEISKENIAMLTFADTEVVTQTASYVSAEEVTAKLGMRSILANREVGSYILTHGTVTGGPFQVGEPVASDNADVGSGKIISVGTGQVGILIISGTFANTDTITGGTSSATADLTANPTWNAGKIYVQDDSDTTTYSAATDYNVSTTLKDDRIGRILFLETGTIAEDDVVHASYNVKAATYTKLKAFKNTKVEGRLRFVSDNPIGENQEILFNRVSLSASGDTSFIGDDWSVLGFSGECLKDETNEDSPYYTIIMD